MKVTLSDIRKIERQLQRNTMNLIKQTMKDKNMGLKDAYCQCRNAYYNKYRCSLPRPYMVSHLDA